MMERDEYIIQKGKHLAFLLRHDTEAFEQGKIDEHGWRMVDELAGLGYSRELLDEIVASNNKQRYEYSADGKMIRARQGHSINVDVELTEATPPDVLYHGTATRFLESIYAKGLIAGNRLYVHLSSDEATAVNVGSRHGAAFVIKIDCRKMLADGCKFYLSNNGVWLTKQVVTKYFIND
ncbi:MAG: RNA 2'-phosphotransferase [Muribaculaceae bacterium]|nr:RNA 2'-phosphotransferase [Muribaculaceae bacterium]